MPELQQINASSGQCGFRRTPSLGLDDVSGKPSFFFTVPARNPRALCCCQSVACIISSMLAPAGWLSRVSTRSCLVTRSTCGSSAFNGGLVLAAAVVTLRRDVGFDLALPFLGAAFFLGLR